VTCQLGVGGRGLQLDQLLMGSAVGSSVVIVGPPSSRSAPAAPAGPAVPAVSRRTAAG
jgi:hypothetical protein